MNKFAYWMFLVFAFGVSVSSVVFGRVVQVIHTNDLHSFMDHAEFKGRGGYAALKRVMTKIKEQAKANGIETLTLDGGDYGEGTSFYLGRGGLDSMQMLNHLGLDAAVIGNHDWLAGPKHLNWLLPQVEFNFQLLGANFLQNSKREFLKEYIKPYKIFERGGIKIGVIGLTTDEIFYSWLAEKSASEKIEDPIAVANRVVPEIKRQADFVIALTHLGTSTDIKLIKKTRGIDLVVGGHSHTCLYEPVHVENPDGKYVPVVQSGNHAEYVGVITLDLEPGQNPVILKYELVPIRQKDGEDTEVLARVEDVRTGISEQFGKGFFLEKIAKTEMTLLPPKDGPTYWGKIFAEAVRKSAKADISFDVPMFHGRRVLPGDLTMEDLFNLYPRAFDVKDKYGWTIWTARVPGWLLDAAIRLLATGGVDAIVGGANVRTIMKMGKLRVQSITLNGLPLNPLRTYKVAFAEGIVRGSVELSPLLQTILQHPRNTGKPVWLELKKYIQKTLHGSISSKPGVQVELGDVTFFHGAKRKLASGQALSNAVSSQSIFSANDEHDAERDVRPDPETSCGLWTGSNRISRWDMP